MNGLDDYGRCFGHVPRPSAEEAKTFDYVTCNGAATTFEKFVATIIRIIVPL
jgi:hypothetical protein